MATLMARHEEGTFDHLHFRNITYELIFFCILFFVTSWVGFALGLAAFISDYIKKRESGTSDRFVVDHAWNRNYLTQYERLERHNLKTEPNYLKIEELVSGAAYEGEGRNFNTAIWCGGKFHGSREKFGTVFIDAELHYDSDQKFGTFKPFKQLGK